MRLRQSYDKLSAHIVMLLAQNNNNGISHWNLLLT